MVYAFSKLDTNKNIIMTKNGDGFLIRYRFNQNVIDQTWCESEEEAYLIFDILENKNKKFEDCY